MGSLLRRPRTTWRKVALTVVMSLVALVMLVPILVMLSGSFKTPVDFANSPLQLLPDRPFLGNYESVLGDANFLSRWYFNSVWVVALQIALRLLVTVTAAYAFAKLNFPFKNALFLFCLSMLMIPQDATLIGRFLLYRGMGLVDTHGALIFPAMADVLMLFMVRQFFMTLPRDLDEAALIDGCGYFQTFLKIILPLSAPVLMTVVLFTFIWNWNDYTSPSIFIQDLNKQLLSVGLTYVSNTERGQVITRALAGSMLVILPTVLLFGWLQRYFIQGISTSGIRG